MFLPENSSGAGGSNGIGGERMSKAHEARLAIVQYFEAVVADPSKFDRQKLQALNEIWVKVRAAGAQSAELSERLNTARLEIRAERERLRARRARGPGDI